ncbi:MAG: hypothetical protein GX616_09825, partial [Planctomycetes bacterium]|nr:hypothetical protein [Planctomycetota bacterium]
VADYNNFEEETAIEPSYTWEDTRGHAVPDLYVRITRAYARLRTETPVRGEYYRDEERPEVFLFDGRRFIHQAAMPRRAAIILTPTGMLDRMRSRHGAGSPSSRPSSAYRRTGEPRISFSRQHERVPVHHVTGLPGR